MHYVLHYCERLRDGTEEGADVYPTVDAALLAAERIRNGFCGRNTEVRLFELGKEIPLTETTVEEAQPAKTAVKISAGSK